MRRLKITEYVDNTKDKSVTVTKETYKGTTFKNQAEATRKSILAKQLKARIDEYVSPQELAFDLHNILGLGPQRSKELAQDWFFSARS